MEINPSQLGSIARQINQLGSRSGSLKLSEGDVVTAEVVRSEPEGLVLELAGRMLTLQRELTASVGQRIPFVLQREGNQLQLSPLVDANGKPVDPQKPTPADLGHILDQMGLPSGQRHMDALRQLLARGDLVSRQRVLQLAAESQAGQSSAPARSPQNLATDEVLSNLLRVLDMPSGGARLLAARQLLARGLPVTRDAVEEMVQTLESFGTAEEPDFQAAAYLRANGLPLSRSTVALIKDLMQNPTAVAEKLGKLDSALAQVEEQLNGAPAADPEGLTAGNQTRPADEFGDLASQIRSRLSGLLSALGDSDSQRLADSLRTALRDQGTSLENRLAQQLEPDSSTSGSRGSVPTSGQAASPQAADGTHPPVSPPPSGASSETALQGDLRVLLGRLAEKSQDSVPGASPALRQALQLLDDAIPDLADALQAQQLRNSADPPDLAERWATFQLPVQGHSQSSYRAADLRVGRRPDGSVDPGHTRLVLRLELERLGGVEVSLNIIGTQMSCSLAGEMESTLPLLAEQFPALREPLERLGYMVGAPALGLLGSGTASTDLETVVPARIAQLDVKA